MWTNDQYSKRQTSEKVLQQSQLVAKVSMPQRAVQNKLFNSNTDINSKYMTNEAKLRENDVKKQIRPTDFQLFSKLSLDQITQFVKDNHCLVNDAIQTLINSKSDYISLLREKKDQLQQFQENIRVQLVKMDYLISICKKAIKKRAQLNLKMKKSSNSCLALSQNDFLFSQYRELIEISIKDVFLMVELENKDLYINDTMHLFKMNRLFNVSCQRNKVLEYYSDNKENIHPIKREKQECRQFRAQHGFCNVLPKMLQQQIIPDQELINFDSILDIKFIMRNFMTNAVEDHKVDIIECSGDDNMTSSLQMSEWLIIQAYKSNCISY
ncbi:UNKNOWN [Stylonychia lemnae]|uniref:Uncharacterized protein n=1 Tax=Stylonychia lemnae TaxID=5949 RepID=A0A077ZSS4_STYLE|nr:UNKNOWN [Stylonychia lemnae]|eukprot:CDW72609.1 UNKNOWN [Stylonychia lemnae]